MTKIYTKSGDDGTTALGGGIRVRKSDHRVEAYGTIDELNAILGCAAAFGLDAGLQEKTEVIQNMLFDAGADLAFSRTEEGWKPSRIEDSHVTLMEQWIDELQAELPELRNFILPGGAKASSFLHQARTVCRRAERLIVNVVEAEQEGYILLRFVNRLSDLLFVMARVQNHRCNILDVIWKPELKS